MRLFIVTCTTQHAVAGTLVREIDQGWEIYRKKETDKPGVFSVESTNVILPYEPLKPFVCPINLGHRFVYNDGKAWDRLRATKPKPII